MNCPKCGTAGDNMRHCSVCNQFFCSNCKRKETGIFAGNRCPICGSHDHLENAGSYLRSLQNQKREQVLGSTNNQSASTPSNPSLSSQSPSSSTSSPSVNPSSPSSGNNSGGLLLGLAIGAGSTIIGFGLKGIWKIMVFPFWLIFIMFKGIFYIFPRFLWRKGKIGRICCAIYIGAWIIVVGVQMIINKVEEKNAIQGVTNSSEVNFYFDNSIESAVLEKIPENSEIKIIEQENETEMTRIIYNGKRGYIESSDFTYITEEVKE